MGLFFAPLLDFCSIVYYNSKSKGKKQNKSKKMNITEFINKAKQYSPIILKGLAILVFLASSLYLYNEPNFYTGLSVVEGETLKEVLNPEAHRLVTVIGAWLIGTIFALLVADTRYWIIGFTSLMTGTLMTFGANFGGNVVPFYLFYGALMATTITLYTIEVRYFGKDIKAELKKEIQKSQDLLSYLEKNKEKEGLE